MTSVRSSGQDASIVFAAQIGVLFIGVVTQIALARLLGVEDRGAFAVVFAYGTTAGVLFSIGIDKAAQYCTISNDVPISMAISAAMFLGVVASVIAIFIGLFAIDQQWSYFNQAPVSAFVVGLLLIPTSLLSVLLQLQVAGQRRFKTLCVGILLQSFVNLAAVFLLVSYLEQGLTGALCANILAFLVSAFVFGADLILRSHVRITVPSIRSFRQMLNYGIRYYPARMGHVLDNKLGIVLLAVFGSPMEVGLFAAVSVLVARLTVLSESVETVLFPRLVSNNSQGADLMESCFRVTCLFLLFTAGFLSLVDQLFVETLFSIEYSSAYQFVGVLVLAMVCQGGAHILGSYFRATDKPEKFSFAVWIGILTNICMFLSLYDVVGMVAAGYAVLFGYLARLLVLVFYYHMTGVSSLSNLFVPHRRDTKLLSSFLPDRIRASFGIKSEL